MAITPLVSKPINEKLREVALYIISQFPDSGIGVKKLAKLLYFSDFNFYKYFEYSITGSDYLRWERGPFPAGLYEVLEDLESQKSINVAEVEYDDDIVEKNFSMNGEIKTSLLSEDEVKHLQTVLKKLGKRSGGDLERLSHIDTPWEVSDPSGKINYELVFYRDDNVSALVE